VGAGLDAGAEEDGAALAVEEKLDETAGAF